MSEKSVYLKISGRVQGVGFRWWTRRQALNIGGISGWVRNCEDGGVEVIARAEEDVLDKLILACRQGPLTARVDRVQFLPPVIKGFLPEITFGKFEII